LVLASNLFELTQLSDVSVKLHPNTGMCGKLSTGVSYVTEWLQLMGVDTSGEALQV